MTSERKVRRTSGFTMVETLAVVCITVILLGVAFVAVANYRRSILQLELDATAKEIYIAAQNHLFTAMDQGLLETYKDDDALGTADTSQVGAYYYISPTDFPTLTTTLGLMLPFGSIDETVRSGGSYIIRYQPSSGRILEVFYASPTGLGGLFGGFGGHVFHSAEYNDVVSLAGPDNAAARRHYGEDDVVIGYYGGEGLADTSIELIAPTVEVENGDILAVTVRNPKVNETRAEGKTLQIRLIVEGKQSGAKTSFDLGATDLDVSNSTFKDNAYKPVVLDDVTVADGKGRFAEKVKSSTDADFIPGENLKIYAWVTVGDAFATVAKSAPVTTNSLFANGSGVKADESGAEEYTAKITSFRHLINLEEDSGFNASSSPYGSVVAVQKTDLVWYEDDAEEPSGGTDASKSKGFVNNTDWQVDETTGEPKPLVPIKPHYDFTYKGGSHAIVNTQVRPESGSGDAGLFEELRDGTGVQDLELIDCSVETTSGNAGMLAGKATGDLELTNILVRDSDGKLESKVSGTQSVGGLVGTVGGKNSTVTVGGCAAAVYVRSAGTTEDSIAGGLIGSCIQGAMTVEHSYAGGRTKDGAYEGDAEKINVTADGTAGGLVGASTGTIAIEYCYATTSVSAGANAGGFIGSAAGGTITTCYATGLVAGEATNKGAFAGAAAGVGFEDCQFFEIINEGMVAVGDDEDAPGLSAIDKDVRSYNEFYTDADDTTAAEAKPYDEPWLTEHYGDTYPYQAVAQLGGDVDEDAFVAKHYGDWPSPETFVINTK